MRIAIVHPWFLAPGGSEKTVNVLAGMYPEAAIFTLLYDRATLPENVRGRRLTASWLQALPVKYAIYRGFLPLFPLACRSLDLRGYDLVISSDHALMKGVRVDAEAVHVCYCYSPMRSLYDQNRLFRERLPAGLRPLFGWVTARLRRWDRRAAGRVTQFVAPSEHIARRIAAVYGREAVVVYPPVETERQAVAAAEAAVPYYLSAGRLTEIKRADLLLQACSELGRPLVVAGSGRQRRELERLAGPTVQFVGPVADAELDRLYVGCRAFLFTAEEDFGMVVVEAQAHGRPVVAYGGGGALETVVDGVTGVLAEAQTVTSVKAAILRFEAMETTFDAGRIKASVARFSVARFEAGMRAVIAAQASRLPE